MEKRKLNIDVAGSIAELQAVLKEFELRIKLYKSLFATKGLDFYGYRVYESGDDASAIDWKASMRTNKILIKQYKEEENAKIVFAIDVSDNMVFGSTDKLKCEYAGEVISALSYIILNSGDKVGFLAFSDKVKAYFPPEKGLNQFGRIVDFLSKPENYGGASNLKSVFDFSINYVDASVLGLIIVSDFLNFNSSLKSDINLVGRRHETFAIMVKDPLDKTLPNVAREIIIEDPNTGQQLLINPRLARVRYEEHSREQESFVRSSFRDAGVDLLSLSTNIPFAVLLGEFLKERARGEV